MTSRRAFTLHPFFLYRWPNKTPIAVAPSLRAERSNPSCSVKKEWIAASRSLSSGAHSRDPLAPRNDERKKQKEPKEPA
jgi:hypothetical protein